MLADPLNYKVPRYQMDPSINAALRGDLRGIQNGAVGVALGSAIARGDLDVAFATGAIGGLTKNAALGAAVGGALQGGAVGAVAGGVLGNALKGPLGPVLGGALGGALGGQLGNLASNFLPPGLDAPIEAVKGVIGNLTKQLPLKTGGAADIVNKIVLVKSIMNLGIKGPGSLIFAAISKNLLSDIPGLDALKGVVTLQSQVAGLAALASNPIAFAAQAAGIKQMFPMIDVNRLAANMIAGAALGAIGGKGFNIKSMVPNLAFSAAGIALRAIPGITPTKDARAPKKTPRPPAPRKPVQLKNLFAEAGAASTMSNLNKPLSQFMGIMSTVAPAVNQISDSAPKTSYGTQKLIGNANTVNWGSGGYGIKVDPREKQRMDLTAKIEKHTQELESMVDYSKLTSMSYPELIKKYPGIKPTMTVAEAMQVIMDQDAKTANTVTSSA